MPSMTRSAHSLDTPRGADWQLRAACRVTRDGIDPEWWWPVPAGPAADAARALHICRTHCPVLAQCRQAARNSPPTHPTVLGGVRYVVDPARHYHRTVPATNGAGTERADGCPYCTPADGGA